MEPWQGPEPRRPPSARVPAGIEEYFPLDTVCDTVPANVDARVSDLARLGCLPEDRSCARREHEGAVVRKRDVMLFDDIGQWGPW